VTPAAARHDEDEPRPHPRPSSQVQDAAPAPRRSARARGAGLVLIVDDNADTRELYALYLQSRGFSAVTAQDGEAGIEIAFRHQPDLIVMDLSMPRLDGVTATQRLKEDSRTGQIPVVILTGYPLAAIPQGALNAGADALLTKPCLPEDLERHVRQLVERRGPPS
jgi:two-component system, cell cycle response regulator DivK